MKKAWIFILLITLFSCKREEMIIQPREKRIPIVETEELKPKKIEKRILLSGDVVTSNSVDAFPDLPGKIEKILVDVGDRVKIDEPLAYIDRNKPGMNFAPSPVLSPITGTITDSFAKYGGMAAPSMPLFRVGTMDKLEIVSNISERDLNRIKPGQRVLITTDTFPDRTFRGRVKELNPVVNPITRSVKTIIEIDNPEVLKPGMYVDLEIVTDKRESAAVVDRESLVTRGGISYLWKYSGNRVNLVEVEKGLESDNNVEIISGVSIGDEIVTKGFTYLEEGIEVRKLEERL